MKTAVLIMLLCVPVSAFAETLIYVGTYTKGGSNSEGVYVSRLDESTGAMSDPVLAAAMENPSFVAVHPTRPLLYAVSEVGDAAVHAFSIQSDGTLTKLNQRPAGGGAACHVSVDPTGQCVAIANYSGGSCASFPIQADGSLGEVGSFHQHVGGSGVNPRRQEAPHAHSINFNGDGTQAFVADLGKDQIVMYDVDVKKGSMAPSKQPFLKMPAGGGPRHFCFRPDFKFAYSNLELTMTAVQLRYDNQQHTLELGEGVDTIPSSDMGAGNSTAECLVHPSGKFLYVSNRGHNTIAAFSIDASTGKLTPIGNVSTQGETPRGFGVDPSGRYLVVGNQNSGSVVSFQIDSQTGKLTSTDHQIKVDSAVNVRFLVR